MFARIFAVTVVIAGLGCGKNRDDDATAVMAPVVYGNARVRLSTPQEVQKGGVALEYRLADDEGDSLRITVSFSTDGGGTYSPATQGLEGDGRTALSSSPGEGEGHVFVWNSLLDQVALDGVVSRVRIRIQPSDGTAGVPEETAEFTVDNGSNAPPRVAIESTPSDPQRGLVGIPYLLFDSDDPPSPCAVSAEFSTDGGATFRVASPGPGGSGTMPLPSSATGVRHTFVWNSWQDLGDRDFAALLRISPTDGEAGESSVTEVLQVTNGLLRRGESIAASFPLNSKSSVVHASDNSSGDLMATDDRFLYVLGRTEDSAGWQLEKRDLFDGHAESSFGDRGTVVLPIDFKPQALALGEGALYIAGRGSTTVRLEKRSTRTGSPLPGFGEEGAVTIDFGTEDQIVRMVIDASYAYLVVSHLLAGSWGDVQIRFEKRNLSDGAPVLAFGRSGVIIENVESYFDGVVAMTVDESFLYVAGVQNLIALEGLVSGERFLEKRRLSDGGLDSSFGRDGRLVTGSGFGLPLSMATQGGSLYTLEATWPLVPQSEVAVYQLRKRESKSGSEEAVVTLGFIRAGELVSVVGSLRVSGDSLYVGVVVGSDMGSPGEGDSHWLIQGRAASDLTLQPTFGSGGSTVIDPTPAAMRRLDLSVSGGVLFVAGLGRGRNPVTQVSGGKDEPVQTVTTPTLRRRIDARSR